LLTAFNATGFSLGADASTAGFVNNSGTFASWTFRKQPKFFDVVTYTGTGANRTIAHSLGSVPGCIMIKQTSLSGQNWRVWHTSLDTTGDQALALNLASSQGGGSGSFWNYTLPTSSVFTVGTDESVNASGQTYVAYVFATNAGGFGLAGTDNVISCGSYTSTGSALSVSLGYEPQWLLFKPSSNAGNWELFDNMRGFQVDRSGATVELQPNTSAAEAAYGIVGPTSTGFTFDNGGSSVTYIYIAIRRGPMKVPTDGTKVFLPISRSGTGSNVSVTGAGFPPDLLIGTRQTSGTGSIRPSFQDRLRGATYNLISSGTASEASYSTSVTSFDQNGVSLGSDTSTFCFNYSGTYIEWLFRRAPSFFDVVCYTGTGVARTVTHNLTVAPELMIVKQRNTANDWPVYAAPSGNNKVLYLNFADAQVTRNEWNVTTPTASVFSVNSSAAVNQSGSTYVAYLFATCPGVSKVGSYTGNGTNQTIDCGFAAGARFILIKSIINTGDWYIWDSARGIVAANDPHVSLNTAVAEVTTDDSIDPDNSGFIVNQVAATNINVLNASYLFLAIA
jgi:hypothetical protein